MSTIAFIGLGIMGSPMAVHLQNAGHTVIGYNRTPEKTGPLVAAGGRAASSVAEAVADADVVAVMVPDSPDVTEVLTGEDGVFAAARPGTLVIDFSSIRPDVTVQLAEQARERGFRYLDAPVSGGEVGAKNQSLTIMCGGARSTFERLLPLLEIMGKNITLVGEENGAGQTCKVANQIVVALTIEAVAEALVFASKAGADPAKVREALMGGFAGSKILEIHGERMIKRTFEPGFRIALHQKDLNLALQSARELGVALPNTGMAQALFSACVAQGGGDWDHSAMVKALEVMAQHPLVK